MRNKNTKRAHLFWHVCFYPTDCVHLPKKYKTKNRITALKEISFFLFSFMLAINHTFTVTIICKCEYFFFRVLNGLKLYSQHLKYFLSLGEISVRKFSTPFLYECITLTLGYADTSFIKLFTGCVHIHDCV